MSMNMNMENFLMIKFNFNFNLLLLMLLLLYLFSYYYSFCRSFEKYGCEKIEGKYCICFIEALRNTDVRKSKANTVFASLKIQTKSSLIK